MVFFPSRVNRFLLARSAARLSPSPLLLMTIYAIAARKVSGVSFQFRLRDVYLAWISDTAFRYLTCFRCPECSLTAATVTLIIEIRRAYEEHTTKSIATRNQESIARDRRLYDYNERPIRFITLCWMYILFTSVKLALFSLNLKKK